MEVDDDGEYCVYCDYGDCNCRRCDFCGETEEFCGCGKCPHCLDKGPGFCLCLTALAPGLDSDDIQFYDESKETDCGEA